ncbi:MAG: hypothetical protein LBU64_00100 [Planctomycetota bacterium]|jgi:hypothetical protein|nr:hypothetical protein [Planctomycetota bacterium]
MEMCDEIDARIMSKALTGHARDIYRYANAFCLPSAANQEVAEGHREKFSRIVRRMLDELQALLLLARYKGISRFCNLELIEAYAEGAESAMKLQESALFRDKLSWA